jgi:hypothetical protein
MVRARMVEKREQEDNQYSYLVATVLPTGAYGYMSMGIECSRWLISAHL